MDETTLSKFGWIIIGLVVFVLILAGIYPLGNKVVNSSKTIIEDNQSGYVLYFESNGGEPVESSYVYYGNEYGALPVPVKAGNTFVGWYTNISGGAKIHEDTVFLGTSDTTLYAHWE